MTTKKKKPPISRLSHAAALAVANAELEVVDDHIAELQGRLTLLTRQLHTEQRMRVSAEKQFADLKSEADGLRQQLRDISDAPRAEQVNAKAVDDSPDILEVEMRKKVAKHLDQAIGRLTDAQCEPVTGVLGNIEAAKLALREALLWLQHLDRLRDACD